MPYATLPIAFYGSIALASALVTGGIMRFARPYIENWVANRQH